MGIEAVVAGWGRRIHIAILAWVSMLATDLLIHGGILATLYARPSPFLLDPETAFRRIPAGYFAFLLLAVLFTEIATRLGLRGWRSGAAFGLSAGAAVWAAFALGLYSISVAPSTLLAGWFAGQTLELGVAGALIGAALGGVLMTRLWRWVALWCVLAFAITVLLQNTGLAPSGRVLSR